MINFFYGLSRHFTFTNPWTDVYGTARSLLAAGTLLTFLFNDFTVLFRSDPNHQGMIGNTLIQYGLFYLLSSHLGIAKLIAVSILGATLLGWRPRITAVLHWYVSVSFTSYSLLIDGGDQITTVLCTLLLPICLTDTRKWHWHLSPSSISEERKVSQMLSTSTLWVIRIQVGLIYFDAAVEKLRVAEWVNGTALYYWLGNPYIGLSTWLKPFFFPLLKYSYIVVPLSWGVILVEILLFMGLVMEKRYRTPLLALGIAFHALIVVAHGLVSFFLAMSAALILFLRPPEQLFDWSKRKFISRFVHFARKNSMLHKRIPQI